MNTPIAISATETQETDASTSMNAPMEPKVARLTGGLQKALAHAGHTHTLGDVAEAVERGEAQLWTSEGAVIVTEVKESPQKKVCRIWLAAGGLEEVMRKAAEIERWAESEGCEAVEIIGRPGWKRAGLKAGWHKQGWKHAACVYRKELMT